MNHMNHLKKLSLLLVVMGLLFSIGSPVALSQDPDSTTKKVFLPIVQSSEEPLSPEEVVFREVSESEQLAAEGFWTREELLSAEPLPMPLLDGLIAADADDLQAAPASPMEMVPGSLPDPELDELAKTLYSEDWADPDYLDIADDDYEIGPLGYSYPPPFTRYYVNNHLEMWKKYPWMTMGRLFFNIPGLTSRYSCSASVAVGRAVWTAGHCVYTKGRGWHTNMVFVPAYRYGVRPYGTFTVFSMATLGGWKNHAYKAYDIAMIAVGDRQGKKVSEWVGSLGAMWNASSEQHFHAFGYPGNLSSSRYLIACAASTSRRDPQPGPNPIGIGCDMQHGSSGGPWLVTYDPYISGYRNYVNGVVSYGYASTKPKEFYSPYFGDGAKNLYNWGKGK